MSLDKSLATPALIGRFEPYFKHVNPTRHVLEKGDRSIACKNAKAALAWLGFARTFGDDPELFDEELSQAVKKFQRVVVHRNKDGSIGPGTRSRLVAALLEAFGVPKFQELDSSEVVHIPTVFLSYAWSDSPRVDKLDQWLRDHGIRVTRDIESFKAGANIPDSVWDAVLSADKVIAIYSKQSKTRDWPTFERQIAEKVEQTLKTVVLVYVRLDDTPLHAYDPHRIAIDAKDISLKQVGLEIQKSLGVQMKHMRVEYDENAPL